MFTSNSLDHKEMPPNISQPLSMSGNGSDSVGISSVFLTNVHGKLLTELVEKETPVVIKLQDTETASTGELVIFRNNGRLSYHMAC